MVFFAIGKAVGALEFDVCDGETTGVRRRRGLNGFDFLTGQFLEFFETPTLLFEQTILTLADEISVTRGSGSISRVQRRKAQQSQAQPRHKGG
ncbi:hypothetical protein D3C81_1982820 [compost metagenome]